MASVISTAQTSEGELKAGSCLTGNDRVVYMFVPVIQSYQASPRPSASLSVQAHMLIHRVKRG